ncbi:MAG: BON domain-containing protein [Gemmatimonas sp.]|nr:BON domain-containing protein [Gemmatimonas sp.]
MATDFGGDLYDFQNMSDDEIRALVVDQLREYPNLAADEIDVRVKDGTVTLEGRVGTDAEVQVATEALDDVLGLDNFEVELVVDELRRGDAPAAADDAIAEDEEVEDQIGEPDAQQSDTAEHLVEHLDSETFGTHDIGRAIRDASSYSPPDRPISDGYGSREDH